MKRLILGFVAAAFVHLLILLFGGIFFLGSDDPSKTVRVEDIDVLNASDEKKDEKKEPKQEELEKRRDEELEAAKEKPPDMRQLVDLEREEPSLADATPQLSALSLAALESALDPGAGGGGGEFGSTLSLASGGRIGGTASADGGDTAEQELGFGLADLDQSARPLFQSPPSYPTELRQRKVEGVVTLVFVVDAEGRVVDLRVERSSDPAFEGPALDAVRRWKFEPAVRAGKKAPSRLRIPIRFSINS